MRACVRLNECVFGQSVAVTDAATVFVFAFVAVCVYCHSRWMDGYSSDLSDCCLMLCHTLDWVCVCVSIE